MFIYVLPFEIQLSRWESWDHITQFNPVTFCSCPTSGCGFPASYVVVFLMFNDWRLEVVVCFVYIGGIVDHHCLEVFVRFVYIGGIVDHHCLEVVVRFVYIGGIVDHHCLNFLLDEMKLLCRNISTLYCMLLYKCLYITYVNSIFYIYLLLTTRNIIAYIENDACPEGNDTLKLTKINTNNISKQ